MIDPGQVLIISAITVMTVLLTILGVQLIFVLRELHQTLGRINKIVFEFEKIGSSISHGYSEVTGFVTGIKKIFDVVEFAAKNKKGNGKNKS